MERKRDVECSDPFSEIVDPLSEMVDTQEKSGLVSTSHYIEAEMTEPTSKISDPLSETSELPNSTASELLHPLTQTSDPLSGNPDPNLASDILINTESDDSRQTEPLSGQHFRGRILTCILCEKVFTGFGFRFLKHLRNDHSIYSNHNFVMAVNFFLFFINQNNIHISEKKAEIKVKNINDLLQKRENEDINVEPWEFLNEGHENDATNQNEEMLLQENETITADPLSSIYVEDSEGM